MFLIETKHGKITVTDNKKERILDAAFDMFKQYGFMKTTVDEIARLAQVGKGTIYFYFKNKEDILITLVDREMSRGFVEVNNAVSKEKTARGRLEKLLETAFGYFHKNAMVSKVMAMDPGLVLSIITQKNREYQSLSMAGIKSLLEQGRREGVFREVDLDKTAYTIDSLIRSFHYLSYLGLEVYKPEEILDTVLDLLFSGLDER